MFRKMRNLHLWIGLITSIIILMESVTGLMLAHPSLMGIQSRAQITERNSQFTSSGNQSITASDLGSNQNTSTANQSSSSKNSQSELTALRSEGSKNHEADNSLMGLIKGLHEGRLGNLDITWVVDIAALSMILLTITGIYLSIKILRGQKTGQSNKE